MNDNREEFRKKGPWPTLKYICVFTMGKHENVSVDCLIAEFGQSERLCCKL
jgi:hypothetical protein